MYIIARNVREGTEALKDSNSSTYKDFDELTSAESLVKKLNTHIHASK